MDSLRRQQRRSPVKPGAVSSANQQDLFQQLGEPPPIAADLDINLELLGAITHAIREGKSHGLSRPRIVDRMNKLLPDLQLQKKPITERQLNSWTALSQEYKEFPARYLPAFCAATNCDLPLRVLANSISLDLVDAREAKAKRLGELQLEATRIKQEQRELARSFES